RLEAVSFWRKTLSSRRMRSTSTRAVASSEVLINSKPRKATRGTSLPSGPAFAPPPAMMARKIPNAAFMAEGHSRARASVISTSVILHMRIGACLPLLDGVLAGDLTDQNAGQNRQTTLFFIPTTAARIVLLEARAAYHADAAGERAPRAGPGKGADLGGPA